MITEEQIQAIVRRIVEGYQPDRVILFGSYAYGAPTEDSDLDLLVIKPNANSRAERAVAVRRLVRSRDMPAMDILVRTPEEVAAAAEVRFTVEAQALHKGRVLYAAA